jgi:hypothetical protein
MWTDQDEAEERARVAQAMRDPHAVFVFGSNLAGHHGAGAALYALQHYGAEYGIGEGLRVRSYAFPTLSGGLAKLGALSLRRFVVTRVGCGLAGFSDAEIIETIPDALPPNIELPPHWTAALAARGAS